MAKIKELLERLCPEGVEFKELGEVAKIKNGKDWKRLGEGNIPVYGTGGVMSYVDTFAYNKPTVLIPRKGSITNIFYLDEPFWNVDTIYYTEIDTIQIVPKFFYYVIKNIDLEKLDTGSGRPSLTQAILDKILIPIPPLAIQQEIVKILDTFTTLEAELEARKKQYDYYREELLTFGEDVEWKALGEVGKLHRGTAITAKETKDGEIPVVANAPKPIYFHSESNRSGETIVVARSGAYAGLVSFWNQPIFLTDAFSVFPDAAMLKAKFVYYLLKQKQDTIHSMKKGSGVPHVRVKDFESYSIPIPPLAEQERIVSILDKFDALVNNTTPPPSAAPPPREGNCRKYSRRNCIEKKTIRILPEQVTDV